MKAENEFDIEIDGIAPQLVVVSPGEISITSKRSQTSCTKHCKVNSRFLRTSIYRSFSVWMLISLVFSAIPYISFLLIYAANCRLLILPTSEGGGYEGCGVPVTSSDQSASVLKKSCSSRLFDLGSFEVSLLGFSPNRLIASYQLSILDFLSTGPYLAHYILPIVYPLALVVDGRVDCARQFYRLVGWTMWMHYFLWFLIPTGPPWYYDTPNGSVKPCSPGSTSGMRILNSVQNSSFGSSISAVAISDGRLHEGPAFARVDAMTGGHFFRSMFAANPVPYAAFPSGHVAWPTCMLLTQPWVYRWPFFAYVGIVTWATMYSGHHYLSDVIGALIVVLYVNKIINQVSTWSTSSIDSFCDSFKIKCSRIFRIQPLARLNFCRESNSISNSMSSPRRRSP